MNILKLLLGIFDHKIYGEAKFMGFFEMKRKLSKNNKGFVFNKHRLSLEDSYKNLALIAPTGSGKTTRYVISNILKCSGSIVVTDPSGEIHRKTSHHMKKRGYKVQVLNPADLKNSLQFNPMERFRTPQEIKQLATILGNQNTAQNSDPFWHTGAINILYILLMALKDGDKKHKHLGTVRNLLNDFGVNGEGIKNFLSENLDKTTYGEFKSFISKDSKTISGFLSSASMALELWSDPNIVEFTKENSINIQSLRKEKTIIYLIIPEHLVKYFSIIINLFYSACFEYCIKETNGNPIFFFLDEFGNLGKINNFSTIATTLRKRKCSINIILQELAQLTTIYGQNEAKNIFSGGMANKLFFSGLDLETCTYLERILGKTTVQETVEDETNEKGKTITVGKPLMSVDQIRMMKEDQAILISGRQKPIKLKMPAYFNDRRLRRMVDL